MALYNIILVMDLPLEIETVGVTFANVLTCMVEPLAILVQLQLQPQLDPDLQLQTHQSDPDPRNLPIQLRYRCDL